MQPRTWWSLQVATLVVVAAWASPASARPSCDALAASPRSESSEPITWAGALWLSVAGTEQRLSGQSHRPTIAWVATPQSGAWYCAAADTVYVASALVDYAWQGRAVDGASLLGFVLAHELAHRRFDPAPSAADAPGFSTRCDDSALRVETRADRRAAFLLALSPDPTSKRSLSPFVLARRDTLTALLEAELGWTDACPALHQRALAVVDSVTRMSRLARLYEIAIAMVFIGTTSDAVPTLLAAIDAAANPGTREDPWAAVAELKLTRALAHLDRAARVGWCPDALLRAPLDPSPCPLRCLPVAPAHALLSPLDRLGERAPTLIDRAAELSQVRRLLDEARNLGARPEQVAGIEVCEAFVARDPARAEDAARRLGAALGPGDANARKHIDALRSLIDLQSFLLEETSPIGTASWRAALADRRSDHRWPTGHANDLALAWLDLAPRPTPTIAPLRADPAPRLEAWVRADPCGALETIDLAGGWTLAASPRCARLQRVDERPWELVEVVPTGLSAALSAWERHCSLEPRGTNDAGADVFLARCAAWDGPGAGWLLFAQGQRLERGVRFSSPW